MPQETMSQFIKNRLADWKLVDILAALNLTQLGEQQLADDTTIVETNRAGKVMRIARQGSVDVLASDPEPEPEPIDEEPVEEEVFEEDEAENEDT